MGSMPYYQVPVGGVVKMPGGSFGTGKGGIQKAPPDVAKGVLAKNPRDENIIPRLPKFGDISGKVASTIRVEKPIIVKIQNPPVTGVAERKGSKALDDELRTTRVMGKRPPAPVPTDSNGGQPPRVDRGGRKLPDTGAVGRPVKLPDSNTSPVKTVPKSEEPPKREIPKINMPRNDPPKRSVEPRIDPPKREEPRYTPPPKQDQPRYEPPKREEPKPPPPPKQEQPRNDPPKREEPRPQPKPDSKPDTGKSKKDGKR